MMLKLILTFTLLNGVIGRAFDFLNTRNTLHCYNKSSNYLPNFLSLDPPKNNSIFFAECSCRTTDDGILLLSSMQVCSIESAAKAHPNKKVYLLFTGLGRYKYDNGSTVRRFSALTQYENVNIAHINYYQFFNDSPFSYEQISLSESDINPLNKASNAIRLVTLWRYGGLFLDTTTIVMKPFDDLPESSLIMQNNRYIENAILSFGRKDLEVPNFFEQIGFLFSNVSRRYIYRTPSLITSVIGALPITNLPGFKSPQSDSTRRKDRNLSVFSNKEKSYALHYWNSLSLNKFEAINSNTTYSGLARKYCPEVIKKGE